MQRLASGFGLVELMIALALGVALTAAVMQATLASSQGQRLLDAGSQLQENGRFALRQITADLRTVGFMGCPNLARINPASVLAVTPGDLNFSAARVLGGENNVAADNDYDAVAGTDVVSLQRATSPPARLAAAMTSATADIVVAANPAGLDANDYLMVSDCVSADLFRATGASKDESGRVAFSQRGTDEDGAAINSATGLSKIYGTDAEVLGLQSIVYFIRDSGRNTAKGKDIYSLYSRTRTLGGATTITTAELVEGVEDMQLTYGEDTNQDFNVDQYRTADAVSDWSSVLSVRIDLLLQSVDDGVVGERGLSAQQGLSFNGATVVPDGRLRAVYSSAVAIRNRLP